MKKLRFIALTTVSSISIAALALIACSSDDTIVPITGEGGTIDSPTNDDSGSDGGTDAPVDVFDGGFVQKDFDTRIAESVCRSLARCCFGSATPDAGSLDGGNSFDMTKCISTYRPLGFDRSNQDITVADSGALVIDQQKAQDCVNGIEAITCNASAAGFRGLRQTCFDAVQGKGDVGSPCNFPIECKKGSFCKANDATAAPGTAGTCTELRATDGNCGDINNDPLRADEACTTRGGGDTNRFCQIYDDFDQGTLLAPADWKCKDGVANGLQCALDTWCKDGICNPNGSTPYTCVDTLEVFPSNICGQYIKTP